MTWATQTERGAPGPMRLGLGLVSRFGWSFGEAITAGAVGWYLLTSPDARRSSRDYLARVLGRSAGLRDVVRHFGQFGMAILDRVMLACGRADDFGLEVDGLDGLLATLQRPQGCILLGAHIGSFEVLRTLAADAPVPVWALMYRRNGGALTALLDQLAPALHQRVIEIGDAASMIRARECLERGEMVGILADRVPPGHRAVTASFLGAPAAFPAGPFLVAATLGAPVFLFHGVRTGRRRYRIGIEKFAERVVLRREHRAADLQSCVERYAAALQRLCQAYPYQWFNFFPFWDGALAETSDARHDAPPPGRAAPAGALAGRTG